MRVWITLAVCAALCSAQTVEWPAYGNDPGGARHSAATQITPANVSKLQPAWSYATKDLFPGGRTKASGLETTPVYADGTLFLTSAFGRVIALDPETAAEKWTFDPKINVEAGWGDFTNRGVSLHRANGKTTVLAVSLDARLFAIDATTGAKKWEVNLREGGLRIPPKTNWEYEETSPPCVIGDVVVVGSAVADNQRTDMASGEVRGFDVTTGKQLWSWDPVPAAVPRDRAPGAANTWSVIVADPARGLVFLPTGSPSPDYFGGMRKESNYANSIVALEAKTGKMRWAFQLVHHDLWDYDTASPPVLLKVNGRDAVATGPKSGLLFFLDRETGKPLFPVEERSVPNSDVPGEEASPTQPFPVKPAPLSRHTFEAWGPTPEAKRWCDETLSKLRYDGVFTPPSTKGTLMFPGNIGGLHWGGLTYDAKQNLVITAVNNLAAVVQLLPRENFEGERRSDRLGLEFAAQAGTPFGMSRRILLSPTGTPCTAPPWGLLVAVDTNTGDIKWSVPTGAFGPIAGAPTLGGPISTDTGLTFLGATFDKHIRAYETATGKLLWTGELPTSARSTPMTFVHKGKQYVVISAGGHDPKVTPLGDKVVAFALPDQVTLR